MSWQRVGRQWSLEISFGRKGIFVLGLVEFFLKIDLVAIFLITWIAYEILRKKIGL
jgi:hypothetical protein